MPDSPENKPVMANAACGIADAVRNLPRRVYLKDDTDRTEYVKLADVLELLERYSVVTTPPKLFVPTIQHVKRGTQYQIIGDGLLQCEEPMQDYERLQAYMDNNGTLWFRPLKEFTEDRFITIDPTEKIESPVPLHPDVARIYPVERTPMAWWMSPDGEDYFGPYPTREAAVKAVISDHDGGYICEADQHILRLRDYADTDRFLESIWEDYDEEQGVESPSLSEEFTHARMAQLRAYILQALDAFQQNSPMIMRAYAFQTMRNKEVIPGR